MVFGWYIEHSAGASIVSGNPLICTYQGPGIYFTERVSDLNQGNRIPVEAIKKSLPELEPLFLKRLRYRDAHDELHYINLRGQPIKKLRVLLLRGLTCNDSSLESKIMLEDDDFSRKELDPFVDKVCAFSPSVERNSIYNWFTKNTGLDNWEDFMLLVQINPEFRAIHESYGREEGFHAAYMLYNGVRRHVRARMEKNKLFEQPRRAKNDKPLTKLQQEIDAITDMIFAQYDEHFNAAVITKISQIETEQEFNRLAGKIGSARVEVYTGKPRVKDYREVDITDLLNAESVLKECWGEALYAYYNKVNNINLSKPKQDDKIFLEIAGYFVLMATSSLVEISPLEYQMLYNPHPLIKRAFKDEGVGALLLNKEKEQVLDEIMRVFTEDFKSGRADDILGLSRYSLSDMADAFSNIRSSIPRSYYNWEKLESDITRLVAILNPGKSVYRGRFSCVYVTDTRLERGLKREIERETPKLEQKSKRIWAYLEQEYKITRKKKFLQEVVSPHVGNTMQLLQLKRQAMLEGELFFTKEDVEKILKRFNLNCFIKYIMPRNFV